MTNIYPGAIHIHSTFSDGTGDIPFIIKEAKKAGLKWIVITDHNTLAGKNYEGYHDGVAVIVGDEISPDKGNHFLALDIKEEITQNQPPQDYVNAVKAQGGFGFIAHPDEQTNRKNPWPALRWDDWTIKDFGGIEIWNYMSDWVDNMNIKTIALSILFKNRNIKGPTKDVLSWWDKLNQESEDIIPAVGGSDVHAFCAKAPIINMLKVFSYYSMFKSVVNLLLIDKPLSDNYEEAKIQILSALKNGGNIILNRTLTKQNPEFFITNGETQAHAGEKIELKNNLELLIKLPKKANLRVICNGEVIKEEKKKELKMQIAEKGSYRIEAYDGQKPLLFSNHIKVCEKNA